MTRLPTPGGDDGTWGDILNAFLDISHETDGTLKANVVGSSQIQSGAITNAHLDNTTQTAIASVSSKYTKPSGGIPSTDLASAVQTSLTNADNALTSSQLGVNNGIAQLDGSGTLKVGQVPSSVETGDTYGIYLEHHCVLDGTTDDAANFATALAAAVSSGLPLIGASGKTMAINSQLAITSNNVVFKGQGMTILKTGNFGMFTSSGTGVEVEDLVLDGNFRNGFTGNGVSGSMVCRNVRVTNMGAHGFAAATSGGTLDCHNCDAVDCGWQGGSPAPNGFYCETGGLLRQYDCVATDCAGSGVYIAATAATGCRVDCRVDRNRFAGVQILNDDGVLIRAFGIQNNGYGLFAQGMDRWSIGLLDFRDVGLGYTTAAGHVVAENDAGTSVEYQNCTRNKCNAVLSYRPLGYGLAITQNAGAASSENDFGYVATDAVGAVNTDPGIHFSGGANHNHIGTADVRGHSVGVIIGEGLTPTSNDYNVIDTLYASRTPQAGLRIDAGNHNRVGRVVARDIQCNNATYQGVVSFTTANATDNEVEWIDYIDTGVGVGTPPALAYADANATANRVIDGIRRGATNSHSDANGGNQFWPAVRGRASASGIPSLIVPGVTLTGQTTQALSSGTIYYEPFHVDQEMVLQTLYAEVTTGPASDANLRVGIYQADVNCQPTGAPLFDSGDVAIVSGTTGVQTMSASSLQLPRGRYLKAIQVDTAMTVRACNGGGDLVGGVTTMGATMLVFQLVATATYGAFSSTPVDWATRNVSTGGFRHTVLLRVSSV